ncbi:BcSTE50, mitogen-activated protein kinase [Calycina marina]|uniref:BcSTE50, mitogen-activated protein kinase n=1 Tax=Calycina marina TaxID=1763456 RepID=A0A9P7Z1Q0_9HELO|nr:BcSTE50, mitogen-activated protein kinase [Calycina marina]
MAFESGTAYPESDADDEYERSLHDSSPVLATDSEASPTTSDGLSSSEHTPTTYGVRNSGDRLPETIISEWTADECADFVAGLGLRQYGDRFMGMFCLLREGRSEIGEAMEMAMRILLRMLIRGCAENDITGEVLVALLHDDLKGIGVTSVGHRLTILKSVYDIKVKQDIPMETDNYVPLTADAEAQYATATLKDIQQLVEQLRIRDKRMAEAEDNLWRVKAEAEDNLRRMRIEVEDNQRRNKADHDRLREDLLPVFRSFKEGQPLPYPSQEPKNNGNSYYDSSNIISPPAQTPSSGQSVGNLARKFSTKKLFFDQPKNASPTYSQNQQERSIMEQALDPANAAERAVLSSSHLSAMNNGGSQPSNSPGYPSPNQPSPTSPAHHMGGSTLASRSYRSDLPTPARSTFLNENDGYQPSTYSRDSTKPAPLRRAQTPAPDTPAGSSGASVEIYKSFRVSMEDPCYKVLPAALKKYNINAPWEQYALYIVYGDKERCLGMDEKPLILFKQLDKEGKKPMFMLRKITAPPESQAGDGPGSAGLDPRSASWGTRQSSMYDPPGGVL